MTKSVAPTPLPLLPWGRAVGLLLACAVTLIGIATHASPPVIVVRAFITGITTAIAVRGFVWLIQISSPQTTDESDVI
ncbi:MAG: hypothetical protein KDA96_24270 [Planctomycetaceae bacterium]|nr:hypothetical protein [Planctomycetaceae bacterium]